MIIGIDPGASSGAIAFTSDTAELLLSVHDIPHFDSKVSAALVAIMIEKWRTTLPDEVMRAICEDVHAMPKQGVVSVFKFGRGLGVIEGVLGTLRIPIEYVSPAKWKKDTGLGHDKDLARARAIQLWPDHDTEFQLKKHAGRAEAALLCRWLARRDLKPQHP